MSDSSETGVVAIELGFPLGEPVGEELGEQIFFEEEIDSRLPTVMTVINTLVCR